MLDVHNLPDVKESTKKDEILRRRVTDLEAKKSQKMGVTKMWLFALWNSVQKIPHTIKFATKILVPNEVRVKIVEEARKKQEAEAAQKAAEDQIIKNQRHYDSLREKAERKRKKRLTAQSKPSSGAQSSPGFGARHRRRSGYDF